MLAKVAGFLGGYAVATCVQNDSEHQTEEYEAQVDSIRGFLRGAERLSNSMYREV